MDRSSRKRKHFDVWEDFHYRVVNAAVRKRVLAATIPVDAVAKETVAPPSLCTRCKDLDLSTLMYGTRYPEAKHAQPVVIGTISEVWTATHCPFCRLVSTATCDFGLDESALSQIECSIVPWRADVLEGFQYRTMNNQIASQFVIELRQGGHPVLPLHGSIPNIAPVSPTKGSRDHLGASVLEPRVNLEELKRWVHRCERGHGKRCASAANLTSPFLKDTFMVIDVDLYGGDSTDMVKVVDHKRTRYVALSHVWQQGLIRNCAMLQAQGRPKRPRQLYVFPPDVEPIVDSTILGDAIELCRSLGERYLWVDHLCVVNKDNTYNKGTSQQRKFQIRHMDSVYNHAAYTIIAAQDRGSCAGLPGVRVDRDQGIQSQGTGVIAGKKMILTQPSLSALLRKSAWGSRGWTFQEGLLSRRCLIFTDNEVFFCCHQDMQRESLVTGPPDLRLADIGSIRLSSEFVTSRDLGIEWSYLTYARLINEYTKRDLTHETDKLSAFRGTMNLLSKHLGAPFYFGLPLQNLVTSLCWYTTRRARRRYRFPSWTWADWMSEVHEDFSLTQLPLEDNDGATLANIKPLQGRRELLVESSIARIELVVCLVEGVTTFFPRGSEKLHDLLSPRPRASSFFGIRSLTQLDIDLLASRGTCEFLMLARLHDSSTKPTLVNSRFQPEYVIALLIKREGCVVERVGLLAIPASLWDQSGPKRASVTLR